MKLTQLGGACNFLLRVGGDVMRHWVLGICLFFQVTPCFAADIDELMRGINFSDYQEFIEVLTGERPPFKGRGVVLLDRYSYPHIALARHYLADELSQSGEVRWEVVQESRYEGEDRGHPVHRYVNLILDFPGSERPREMVIAGAHYDTTGKFKPGANDNGSGVAAILSMAKAFREGKIKCARTVRFILFDGEERGFIGSRGHFSKLAEKEPDKVPILFINLDMIGDSTDGQKRLSFDANHHYLLADLLKRANTQTGEGFKLTQWREYRSDSIPARMEKIPSVALFDHVVDENLVPLKRYAHYHSSHDLCANMDCRFAHSVTRLAASAIFEAANSAEYYGARWKTSNPYPQRRYESSREPDSPFLRKITSDKPDASKSLFGKGIDECAARLRDLRRKFGGSDRDDIDPSLL